MKKIVIGCDHGGFNLKSKVIGYLKSKPFLVEDVGAFSTDSCNYPDFAHIVAADVSKGKNEMGILICTSGQGMVITANKHKGVRAALCWNDEISRLAKAHNNANVLCLPANFVEFEDAVRIIEAFFETNFEGSRHLKRVELIENNVQFSN